MDIHNYGLHNKLQGWILVAETSGTFLCLFLVQYGTSQRDEYFLLFRDVTFLKS